MRTFSICTAIGGLLLIIGGATHAQSQQDRTIVPLGDMMCVVNADIQQHRTCQHSISPKDGSREMVCSGVIERKGKKELFLLTGSLRQVERKPPMRNRAPMKELVWCSPSSVDVEWRGCKVTQKASLYTAVCGFCRKDVAGKSNCYSAGGRLRVMPYKTLVPQRKA